MRVRLDLVSNSLDQDNVDHDNILHANNEAGDGMNDWNNTLVHLVLNLQPPLYQLLKFLLKFLPLLISLRLALFIGIEARMKFRTGELFLLLGRSEKLNLQK